MSKLNTDAKRKEVKSFLQKMIFDWAEDQHIQQSNINLNLLYINICRLIDISFQQAYQKGREEEREKFIADLASLLMRTDNNPTAKDLVELQEYYLKLKKK